MNIQSPMKGRPQYSPLSIARSLWKRRVLLVTTWILGTLAVASIVHRLPAIYSAEALILVEGKGIPESYVLPTVKADLPDRLGLLKQQVLSYDRLKQIIEELGLYHKERRVFPEAQVIEKMRADITMDVEQGWASNRPATFRIGYRGPNPILVARVANHVGRFFIDENLRERETQATLTSEFLSGRLAEAKRKMEEQEERVSKYKSQFNGELPEQGIALMTSLSQSKARLLDIQEAIDRAEQNKLVLQNSLNLAKDWELRTRHMAEQLDSRSDSPAQFEAEPPAELESQRLENELKKLRLRYGEQHPDVRRLVAVLKAARAFEKAQAREQPKTTSSTQVQDSRAASVTHGRSYATPELAQSFVEQRERVEGLKAQYSLALRELGKLGLERRRTIQEIASIESHIKKLPIREQELAAIVRDYESLKANYHSLLDKKLSADLSARMERHQKAEIFVMLDPARVPQVPIKPRRKLLAGAGSVFCLAFAAALALGLELKRGVFLGEWELPQGTVVLGRVPRMKPAVKTVG